MGDEILFLEAWTQDNFRDFLGAAASSQNTAVAIELFNELEKLRKSEKLLAESSITSLAVIAHRGAITLVAATDFGPYFAWHFQGGVLKSFNRLQACCDSPSLRAKEAAQVDLCKNCKDIVTDEKSDAVFFEEPAERATKDLLSEITLKWCEEAAGDPLEAILLGIDFNLISELLTEKVDSSNRSNEFDLLNNINQISSKDFTFPL